MKPFVFMCLSIIGLAAGLFVGAKTDPGINQYSQVSIEAQRANQTKHYAMFALGGAAVGAAFGWVACNIEEFPIPK